MTIEYGSRRIFKFTLPVEDRVQVAMPRGALVLHLGNQNGKLCVWVLVDDPEVTPAEMRVFYVVGTGNPVPERAGLHLGTVQIGPGVWHVFEEAEE